MFARVWAAAVAEERLEFDSLLQTLLTGAPAGGEREREPGAVSVAREYLHEHAIGQVRLDDLAAAAGLSPAHLVRAFGRAVGMPPHRYQTWLRIERAKRLLVTDDIAIGTVALAVGFHDHPHFSRTFRRWVGVAPSRYRQVAKNVQDRRA
jgi:AraC-like DNA-binding protein